jgi:glucokinase
MDDDESVVVGVDVGGTKILVGFVDRSGHILRATPYPMDRTSQVTSLDSISAALDRFLAAPWDGSAPQALGFGLVGHTDPSSRTWMHSTNIPIGTPVAMDAAFGERYGLPVALDNDVHAATQAELQWGAGMEAANFIYLNVGTGIAAGLICGGQLVRGAANYAGEMGHMVVEPGGDPCLCGGRGCLEPIASGGGILAHVRARLASYPESPLNRVAAQGNLTASTVFQAADAGDPLATAVAQRAVQGLSTALVSLVNLLNPGLIVVGGGVFKDGWLLPRLRDHVTTASVPIAARALRAIVPSPLAVDQVGLLGAASLAWEMAEAT